MMKGRVMEKFRFRISDFSIHTKLTLSHWIVAVVPLIIIFSITSIIFFNVTVDNAKTQAQIALDKTVEELELWVSRAKEGIFSLSTDINVQKAIRNYTVENYKARLDTRDFIRNRLANIYSSDMRTVNLSLYLSDSGKIFSKDFMDLDLYLAYSDAEWFKDLLTGDAPYYFGTGKSLEKGEPVIILANTIFDMQNGKVIGISYVELDRKKVYDIFKTLINDNANAVLLGDELIASDHYIPNKNYFSVYGKALGLQVEYRLPLKEIQKDSSIAYLYFIAGLVAVLFFLYFIDKLFTDWFAKRIIKLRNATKEIASGNLEVAISDRHNDEIGDLSKSLNTMARDMKLLIEKNYLSQIENQHARIQALQSQINPHFIYNTLESISMLAVISDNYEIVEITHAFSAMMRYAMNPDTKVKLSEELENVKNYVTIQKIRVPEKFEISYRIADNCLSQSMPRLCLQPLVENAIKHGFENIPQGHCHLLITARKTNKCLIIHVYNDGEAISEDRIHCIHELLKAENNDETMDCFALRNLSRRLRLTYGENGCFRIRSRSGFGTITSIKIPLQ